MTTQTGDNRRWRQRWHDRAKVEFARTSCKLIEVRFNNSVIGRLEYHRPTTRTPRGYAPRQPRGILPGYWSCIVHGERFTQASLPEAKAMITQMLA